MTSQSAVLIQPRVGLDERNFYLSMGIACVLIIFVGFAPSYFLSPFFERPAYAPPLSVQVHLHAAIFTAWLALFIAQTALVRADRRDLHRKLGILGLALAIALVSINMATVINAIAEGHQATRAPPIPRLYVAISASLITAGFIAAGMYFRKDRDTHKRLMLLATISMIGPALNRIVLRYDLGTALGINPGVLVSSVTAALILAGIVNDFARRRRVHSAYFVGLVILIGAQPLRRIVPQTEVWQSFAKWAIG